MNSKLASMISAAAKYDSWVAFDCETTGFPPRGRLIELGAVHFNRDRQVISEYHGLAKPPHRLPKMVSRLTGISDLDLMKSPTAHHLIHRFLQWLPADIPLIAHNINFDLHILAIEVPGCNQWISHHPMLDSVQIARSLNQFTDCRLATIARSLDLSRTDLHRARADIYVVQELFLYALSKSRITGGSMPKT